MFSLSWYVTSPWRTEENATLNICRSFAILHIVADMIPSGYLFARPKSLRFHGRWYKYWRLLNLDPYSSSSLLHRPRGRMIVVPDTLSTSPVIVSTRSEQGWSIQSIGEDTIQNIVCLVIEAVMYSERTALASCFPQQIELTLQSHSLHPSSHCRAPPSVSSLYMEVPALLLTSFFLQSETHKVLDCDVRCHSDLAPLGYSHMCSWCEQRHPGDHADTYILDNSLNGRRMVPVGCEIQFAIASLYFVALVHGVFLSWVRSTALSLVSPLALFRRSHHYLESIHLLVLWCRALCNDRTSYVSSRIIQYVHICVTISYWLVDAYHDSNVWNFISLCRRRSVTTLLRDLIPLLWYNTSDILYDIGHNNPDY